jgi:2-haloacid dehalogenase
VSAAVVTFDLFSALLDSRRGGADVLTSIGRERGWSVDGGTVYDRWDALNKAAQRDCHAWVPFRALAERALAGAYAELGIAGDAATDIDAVVASMAQWPLWPDAAAALPAYAAEGSIAGHRIGLLSNVDDDIYRSTQAAPFIDPAVALTSQRLGVYKPSPRIYTSALEEAGGPMVHVATSARDVRGALEAGCPMVRLRRPGHDLDPEGPRPAHEVDDIRDLPEALARIGTS